MNFGAVFEKEHFLSFFAARVVDIVEDKVLYDLMSGNSLQRYQHNIRVAKFLFQ